MRFVLTLFLIAVLVKTGHSIKCFECDSEHNIHSCKDPFKVGTGLESKDCTQLDLRVGQNNENAGFGDLPGTPPVVAGRTEQQAQEKINCFKVIIQKPDGNGLITARGCGFMGINDQCKHITNQVKDHNGTVKHCLVCDKHDCNSAPHNIMSITSLILIPVILALRGQLH